MSHETFWAVTDTEIGAEILTNNSDERKKIHCALNSNLIVRDEFSERFLATGQRKFFDISGKVFYQDRNCCLLYTYTLLICFAVNFGFFCGNKEGKN